MSYPKNKIINDPIYGFINIPFDLIWQLIEHPFFQRLRRISQLGLSSLVYPGANHSRFHHAIGAMHLMNQAINTLKTKGHSITKQEHEASLVAILLHDIGHGPFSHALEKSIVNNLSHETISLLFMQRLNEIFDQKLSMAIDIFQKKHKKTYLNQLISSQLDVDRLDYLNRDSFYSGVNEGIINSDRIISTLNVYNQELVVDYKGLYSIEKFIIARKLMYWQVYLHKTVLSAEYTLMQVLKRAKELTQNGFNIYSTPNFKVFLNEKNAINLIFFNKHKLLDKFALIDDSDLLTCLKSWTHSEDQVLKILSNSIINRKLLKIKTFEKKNIKKEIRRLQSIAMKKFKLTLNDTSYLIFPISINNQTYNFVNNEIKFLKKNNVIVNLSEIKNEINMNSKNSRITKHYICYPKEL
ncbi:MAG: HD domain-containing protein [Flavobacteriales bacterium TMED191]|nr:MAG: HD domain-containing protein [Flavobacteriales bacterium TMED191]